jgi:hypothetical protein
MQMAGHKTRPVYRCYAIADDRDLRVAVGNSAASVALAVLPIQKLNPASSRTFDTPYARYTSWLKIKNRGQPRSLRLFLRDF